MVQKHFEVTEYENKALKSLLERTGYRKEAHLLRDLIMNTIPIELPKEPSTILRRSCTKSE